MGSFTQGGIAFGQSIGGGIENYVAGRERRELLVGKALGIADMLQKDEKRSDEDNKYLKKFDDVNEMGTRQLQGLISEFETGEELQMMGMKRKMLKFQVDDAKAKAQSRQGLADFAGKGLPETVAGFPQDEQYSFPAYLEKGYANQPDNTSEGNRAAGAYPGDYWGKEIKPIYEETLMPPLPPGFETSQRTGRPPLRSQFALSNLEQKQGDGRLFDGEEINPMFRVSEPVGGAQAAWDDTNSRISLFQEKLIDAESALSALGPDETGSSGYLKSAEGSDSGLWEGGLSGLKAKTEKFSRDQFAKGAPKYAKRIELSKLVEEYSANLESAKLDKEVLNNPEEYPTGRAGGFVEYEEEGSEVLPPVSVSGEGRINREFKGYDTTGMNDLIDAEQRAVDADPAPLDTSPVEGVSKGVDRMPEEEKRAALIDSLAQYGLTPADRKQAIDMISEKYPKLKEFATEVITSDGEELGYKVGGAFVKSFPKGKSKTPQGWRAKSRSVNNSTGVETVVYEDPTKLPSHVPTAKSRADDDPELTLKEENAPDGAQAKAFNEASASSKGLIEDTRWMIEQTKKAGAIEQRMYPTFKAGIQTRLVAMRAQMRKVVVGTGSVSEFEQQMLRDAIPDSSDIFRWDSSTIARLESLGGMSERHIKYQGESIGLWDYKPIGAGGQSGVGGTDGDPLGKYSK